MPNNQSEPTGQPSTEAQLQENLNICVAQKCEALAEVERLKALHDMNQPYWAHIQQLKAEIARLRYGHPTNCPCVSAPPEADAMDVARNLLLELGCCFFNRREPTLAVARALTAYGDQRVREGREELIAAHAEIARLRAPPQPEGGEG